MKLYNVGILGATGAVGQEMMKILLERKFPVGELRPIASARSAGSEIDFGGRKCTIVEASDDAFEGLDIVLGAAENDIAERFAPAIVKAGRGVRRQLQRLPSRPRGAAGHPRDQSRGREVAQRHHLQPQLHHHRHPRRHQRAGEGTRPSRPSSPAPIRRSPARARTASTSCTMRSRRSPRASPSSRKYSSTRSPTTSSPRSAARRTWATRARR